MAAQAGESLPNHPYNRWEIEAVDDYGSKKHTLWLNGEPAGVVTEGAAGATASLRWEDGEGGYEDVPLAYENLKYRVFVDGQPTWYIAQNPYFPSADEAIRAVEQVFPLSN